MVFGTTLQLPGEFVDPIHTSNLVDPTNYVDRLKTTMQQLQAPSVRGASQHPVFVHKDLANCTRVCATGCNQATIATYV